MDKIRAVITTDAGLLDAFAFAKAAQDRAIEAFRLRYPPDATVRWVRNDAVQFGQVVQQGYRDRLKVRNVETDAEYWIRAFDVLEAMRRGQ